jgi:hypothetical protein
MSPACDAARPSSESPWVVAALTFARRASDYPENHVRSNVASRVPYGVALELGLAVTDGVGLASGLGVKKVCAV